HFYPYNEVFLGGVMKQIILSLVFLLGVSCFAEETPDSAPEESVQEVPQEAPAATSIATPTPEVASPVAQPTASAVPEKSSVSPWAFGIHFGQLRTKNSESDPVLDGNRTSYTGGVSLEYRLTDQWFLQSELNYMSKGWSSQGTISEVNLKYFEVPLLFKMKFPWNNLAPSLMAGPWIAYLHSAEQTSSAVLHSSTPSITTDTTSTTQRIEYGLYVGAGLDLALSSQLDLGVSVRYGWGLSDLNDYEPFPGVIQEPVYNRVLQLAASLRFRL
ncbi:MAG: hypothetical protein EB078_11015, partial [Proteobacteria bacterium]|nr:hypothetical protein [Pseudomonadota bacterium]NDD05428.1 hypothetical protein [Pseudomonadota bacterium]